MTIGVVGKIGSGKTFFTKYVKDNYESIVVFSSDAIAKEIMESGETSYNGKNIIPYEFFTNEKYQEDVRKNLHPFVFKKIENEIEKLKIKNSNLIYIIESALPSDYMLDICDKLIYIKSSYKDIYQRLSLHRGYSDNQIKLIYNSQNYYEKFYEKADYVINNSEDLKKFLSSIKEVMDEICVIRE